jgi:hypothetical protein
MVASGAIAKERDFFGMCLSENGGYLDFGELNSTRFAPGTMQFTKIVSEGFYSIEIKDIAIDGISIGVPRLFYRIHNDVLGSFVDSGTTVVLVGPFAFQQIQGIMTTNFASLPNVDTLFNAGQCANFSSNMSAIAAYPTFSFLIAGLNGLPDFNVTMNGFNYLMASGQGMYCLGIAGVPSIGVILGDVIMANYYISFDRFNGRLGFAPVTNCQ